MCKMRKIFFIFMMAVASLHLPAQESQTVYNFLRIPVSAHGAALGGDNISVIDDDPSLALENPALLADVTHRTVSFGYMNYLQGSGMYTATYTHVVNDKATVGGAFHYLSYGSMKERDMYGAEIGDFTPSDLTAEALFSYNLAKHLVGGIGAKFIYSKIGQYSSTAAAIDLGINYYHPEADFSISLAFKNLGGQLSAYNEEYETVPFNIVLGATQRIHNTPFRVSLTFSDLNHIDYSLLKHAALGLDVIILPQLYIAGGINFRKMSDMKVYSREDDDDSSHGAGLSVGAGLNLERFKLNISYGKYHVSSSSLMVNAAFNF